MRLRGWIELSLDLEDRYHDLLTGQLAALGFEGFLQEDAKLKAYIGKRKWNKALATHLAYCLQKFGEEFPHLKLHSSIASIREQNWNRVWEQTVGIVDAIPGLVIKPSWKHLRKKDRGKIILHIDPKMSFGTGHHESTRLCLRLMREYVHTSMNILDFGSGTGILAIAAIKMGAKHAMAVDHDPWTITNMKENFKRNSVADRVKVVLGDINKIPQTKFDLVVANVGLPTIMGIHSRLLRNLTRGGILVYSGLLTVDLLTLNAHIKHSGAAPLDIIEENEWAAVALVRT